MIYILLYMLPMLIVAAWMISEASMWFSVIENVWLLGACVAIFAVLWPVTTIVLAVGYLIETWREHGSRT